MQQPLDPIGESVITKLEEIRTIQEQTRESLRVLSETLAAHVRQNIDTFQKMNEYISEQMNYRVFRQGLEENNIALELAKRNLELEYARKRFEALEKEHAEDTEESSRLRLEYEKQKLEMENLKNSLDLLKNSRQTTKDKITAVKPNGSTTTPFNQKMKETIVLTGLATLTAAAVGGLIAFLVFFIRFYIANSP